MSWESRILEKNHSNSIFIWYSEPLYCQYFVRMSLQYTYCMWIVGRFSMLPVLISSFYCHFGLFYVHRHCCICKFCMMPLRIHCRSKLGSNPGLLNTNNKQSILLQNWFNPIHKISSVSSIIDLCSSYTDCYCQSCQNSYTKTIGSKTFAVRDIQWPPI